MKKFFVLAAILAVVLTGCDTNGGGGYNGPTLRIRNESSVELDRVTFRDVSFTEGENSDVIGTWTDMYIRLVISANTWSMVDSGQGTWTRIGNSLTFNSTDNFSLKGTAILSGDILVLSLQDYTGYIVGSYDLTSNDLQTSVKSGTSVTKDVTAGSGYVFFKVNSIDYRTSSAVVVDDKEQAIFTFTNNTVVVKTSDTGNSLTLGSL